MYGGVDYVFDYTYEGRQKIGSGSHMIEPFSVFLYGKEPVARARERELYS